MKGIYQITKKINDTLLSYEEVNVVTFGVLEEVIEEQKQSIFPLVHVDIGAVSPPTDRDNNAVLHTFTLFFTDRVDISDDAPRDIEQYYWGNTNLMDVWHSTLATALQFVESLRRGDLFGELYQIESASLDPFKEEFANVLAGWTLTVTIIVPNSSYICE